MADLPKVAIGAELPPPAPAPIAATVSALPDQKPEQDLYVQNWAVVQQDPSDFAGWTTLINSAEKLDEIDKLRAVYDHFFAEFPLCYGYWKKYAEAEARHGSLEAAAAVYERGVAATPYSADLWGYYAAFKRATPDVSAEDVRGVYERGVAYCGQEYSSSSLWDKYFSFEQEQGSTLHIVSLYTRVLACPTKDLERYYTSFRAYAGNLNSDRLMSVDEFNSLRDRILQDKTARLQAQKAAAKPAAAPVQQQPAAAEPAPGTAAEAGDAATAAAGADSVMADAGKGEGGEQERPPGETSPAPDAGATTTAPGAPAPVIEAAATSAPDVDADPSAASKDPDAEQAAVAQAEDVGGGDTAMPDATMAHGTDAAASMAGVSTTAETAEAAAVGASTAAPSTEGAAPSTEAVAPSTESTAPVVPEEEVVTVGEDDIRLAFFKLRDDYYAAARRELALRKPYEDNIRRPYFHIKPLDALQLYNWAKYLDFTEARGDQTSTIMLFERCLVACASYPEFWMRYIRFLEGFDKSAAKAALDRAVLVYCKRRPEMHLFAASFEERQGDVAGVRARFKQVLEVLCPRLLEALTAAANFELRQGNTAAASRFYDELLSEEMHKDGSKVYPFLAVQYAHFLQRQMGDLKAARKVLDGALLVRPDVRALWEAAINLEEQLGTKESITRALELYEKCTAPPVDPSKALGDRDREELSLRSVDFADANCGDVALIAGVAARHGQRFLLPSAVTAEMRASVNKRANDAAASAAKAQRTDYGQTAAAAGTSGHAPAAGAAAPAAAAAAYAAYPYPYAYPGYGYAYPGYGY